MSNSPHSNSHRNPLSNLPNNPPKDFINDIDSSEPDRAALIDHLIVNMHSLKRTLGGHRMSRNRFGNKLGKNNLSFPQIGLLFSLAAKTPLTTTDLAEQFGVSASAITQMVQPLEDAGYVQRHTDQNDRRVSFLQLSRRGKHHIKSMQRKQTEHFYQVFSVLSNVELQQLITITKKLTSATKRGDL